MRAAQFLQSLLLLVVLTPAGADPLPRGQLVPRVACERRPEQTYALYLPTGYREDRPMPVLFGFSPGGVGREPVELFRSAAERFGVIVVGSNNARNGPMRPILEAQAALWEDVQQRFNVAPGRCVAAGFSGGARMALRLAKDHPEWFTGTIAFGAFGLTEGLEGMEGMGKLGFVLACGEEDFNHWEVQDGAERLQAQSWRSLADRFPKGHVWAPPEDCLEAFTFLHLLTMERGLVPEDPSLRASFLAQRRAKAEAAETEGKLLLASRRWEALTTAFPGSAEALDAQSQVQRLARLPGLKAEVELERNYGRRWRDFDRLQGTSHYPKELLRLHDQLIKASAAEAVNIRRVLACEAMKFQATAMAAMKEQAWKRAAGLLEFQLSIQDHEPWPCLYLASVYAQMAKPEAALLQLREAQRRGYHQTSTLRDSVLLKPLHGRPDFESFLQTLEAR